MLQPMASFRCGYTCKSSLSRRMPSSKWNPAGQEMVERRRRVLIGEFRDEIYADLEVLFRNQRYDVGRAEYGLAMTAQVQNEVPNLIVLNDRFPDQSGWLVAAKLHMLKSTFQVWLYTNNLPADILIKQEMCQIDEVLAYGGGLSRLHNQILDLLSPSLTTFSNTRPTSE